jgi:hypothetical protein
MADPHALQRLPPARRRREVDVDADRADAVPDRKQAPENFLAPLERK